MSELVAQRQSFLVPIALIDRPDLDVRIDRDPEKLEELARDILRRGLIEPLKVVRVGARYEVVDGFRRFLACKSAGLASVECLIFPTKALALEGVKYGANAYREDMSPAEEAKFFYELLTNECGGDIEQVCALTGKKLSYIDNRIALLTGDELVFEAVRDRKISIGVAHSLNKIDDPRYRRYYLEHAIQEGAAVSTVEAWIVDYKRSFGNLPPAPDLPPAAVQVVESAGYSPHRCYLCSKIDPRFIPEQVPIHTHCRLAILDPLLDQARGVSESGA